MKRLLPYLEKYKISILHLEKCNEFIINLSFLIHENYLGFEYLNDYDKMYNHYCFWWDNTSVIFDEYYDFNNLNKCKDYFFKIFYRLYYNIDIDEQQKFEFLSMNITHLFNIEKYDEKDYSVILALYELFTEHGRDKIIT